jgi:hypothetical protein
MVAQMAFHPRSDEWRTLLPFHRIPSLPWASSPPGAGNRTRPADGLMRSCARHADRDRAGRLLSIALLPHEIARGRPDAAVSDRSVEPALAYETNHPIASREVLA